MDERCVVRCERFVVESKDCEREKQVSMTSVMEGTVMEASAMLVARITFVLEHGAGRKTLCWGWVEERSDRR